MPDDNLSEEVLAAPYEIDAANPITVECGAVECGAVECGADPDIMLTQHDDTLGEERVILFDVLHADAVAAAILA
jgi:hypothetical protein